MITGSLLFLALLVFYADLLTSTTTPLSEQDGPLGSKQLAELICEFSNCPITLMNVYSCTKVSPEKEINV